MIVRKILSPTDLSDNSKAGLSYAISLAKEKRAKLSILHVISPPVYALESLAEKFTGENKPPISLFECLRRDAAINLNRFTQGDFSRQLDQIDWQSNVEVGNTAAQIVTVACREEADIIVIAKRERGVLMRLICPSISKSVSREAPCPVLTVCPPKISHPLRDRPMPIMPGALNISET